MTDKTREAFEAFLNPGNHAGNLSPWLEPGRYEKETHQLAWLAWQAATARAMAEAVRVPDGWQLVPKTHTMDMSVAFAEAFYSRARTVDDDDISDWWDALIAAAPQPKEAL